jgi:hypothetical protein
VCLVFDLAIALLGIYPTAVIAHKPNDIFTKLFTVALFAITKD